MIYVCSAPVLVGCNVFWISVVTMLMLLNMKSPLKVRLHQKLSISNYVIC